MNVSPFVIQLAVVVVLVVAVAGWTLSFVLRADEGGAGPIIKAHAKELQKGWYQLDTSIAIALRRVRPRAARLMAPITSVSTSKGDFQVWSDPSTDGPKTSIPLHLEMGPHEERHGFAAQGVEAHATAWLFLPEGREISELALELAFVDRAKNLRRVRFGVALLHPQ